MKIKRSQKENSPNKSSESGSSNGSTYKVSVKEEIWTDDRKLHAFFNNAKGDKGEACQYKKRDHNWRSPTPVRPFNDGNTEGADEKNQTEKSQPIEIFAMVFIFRFLQTDDANDETDDDRRNGNIKNPAPVQKGEDYTSGHRSQRKEQTDDGRPNSKTFAYFFRRIGEADQTLLCGKKDSSSEALNAPCENQPASRL